MTAGSGRTPARLETCLTRILLTWRCADRNIWGLYTLALQEGAGCRETPSVTILAKLLVCLDLLGVGLRTRCNVS